MKFSMDSKSQTLNWLGALAAAGIGLMLVSCAESSAKNDVATKAVSVASASPGLQMIYFTGRLANDLKAEDCPLGANGWQKGKLSALTRAASACAQFKKLERLEQIANFMAKTYANEPWGAFYLSVSAQLRSEPTRALWMIELAIKKAPNMGLLYYQRGRVHWDLNELAISVADYNEALKHSPNLSDAHILLAQLATRNQDFKSAQSHYAAALSVEPENYSVAVALAETDMSLGQVKPAIALYETAVNLSPRNISYRLRLASLYETSQKDYEQALNVYRRIKTIITESRTPADTMGVDLAEKIKKLEALVSPPPKEDQKVTSAAQSAKVQVKK